MLLKALEPIMTNLDDRYKARSNEIFAGHTSIYYLLVKEAQ